MKFTFITSLLTVFIVSLFSSFQSMAVDMHGVMCGGEIRSADNAVVEQFMADNPGVNVTMEAVPWGTCQDKVINLAIGQNKSYGDICTYQNKIIVNTL